MNMKEFKLTEGERRYCQDIVEQLKDYGEIKKEGIIIHCNQEKVNFILFGRIYSPEDYTTEELVEIRNILVIGISEIIESLIMNNYNEEYEEMQNILQVVTWTIDKYLYERR